MSEPIWSGIVSAIIAEIIGALIIVLLTGQRKEVQTLVSRLGYLGFVAVAIGLLVYWSAANGPKTTVYFSPKTIHLGDQPYPGWEPGYELCFDVDFDIRLPIRTLTLELETYGAEAHNPIYLNGYEVAVLLPQGVRQPNEWTEARSVLIPTDKLGEGHNRLVICSGLVEVEPDFTGDKDDFQIRNIRLTAE